MQDRVDLLDKNKLSAQKEIFEKTLVRELLYEIKFLWDIQAGRSTRRATFSEKLLRQGRYLVNTGFAFGAAGAGGANPFAGLAVGAVAGIVNIAGDVAQAGVSSHAGKKHPKLGDFFSKLALGLDMVYVETIATQLAKEASLRYEFLIAKELSEDPENSVIPLARIGAQRIITFLMSCLAHIDEQKKQKEPAEGPDLAQAPLSVNLLLRGLLEGHSGRFVEGYTNHKLKPRSKDEPKLTVEGIYGRPAMRKYPRSSKNYQLLDKWKIQAREKALHKEEKHERFWSWGKTKLRKDGSPKYLIFANETEIKHYDYEPLTLKPAIKEAQEARFNYYPTVKIVDEKDINKYQLEIKKSNKKESFIDFIQRKHKKLRVDQVWVEAKLKDITLEGGDYSNVDFRRSQFENVTLKGVNLAKADFSLVNLRNLKCLPGLNGKKVNLNQANLSYCDLTGAQFKAVTLIDTLLRGAIGLDKMEEENKYSQAQFQAVLLEQINVFALQEMLQAREATFIEKYQALYQSLLHDKDSEKGKQALAFFQSIVDLKQNFEALLLVSEQQHLNLIVKQESLLTKKKLKEPEKDKSDSLLESKLIEQEKEVEQLLNNFNEQVTSNSLKIEELEEQLDRMETQWQSQINGIRIQLSTLSKQVAQHEEKLLRQQESRGPGLSLFENMEADESSLIVVGKIQYGVFPSELADKSEHHFNRIMQAIEKVFGNKIEAFKQAKIAKNAILMMGGANVGVIASKDKIALLAFIEEDFVIRLRNSIVNQFQDNPPPKWQEMKRKIKIMSEAELKKQLSNDVLQERLWRLWRADDKSQELCAQAIAKKIVTNNQDLELFEVDLPAIRSGFTSYEESTKKEAARVDDTSEEGYAVQVSTSQAEQDTATPQAGSYTLK